MDIIRIQQLKKYFGEGSREVKALDGIDLTIEKGRFTALTGASGSGKTTLFHLIGGLYEPTEGKVIVDGQDLSMLTEEQLTVFRRRKIGFIFQNYHLIPELTVEENIVFPLALDDLRADEVFLSRILGLLGLEQKRKAFPNMLSGGAQQCTAIARALINRPAILLADEPTGNLDLKTTRKVAGLLKNTVAAFHQTLIMITHNRELSQLADRIIKLKDGRIEE